MGHSYTTLNGQTILTQDLILQVWLVLVCDEIDQMENAPLWLQDAQEKWWNEVENGINGAIEPDLDRILDTSEKLKIMIGMIEKIQDQLSEFGEKIPADFLNQCIKIDAHDPNRFTQDQSVEPYVGYGQKLLGLLKAA